MAHQKEFEVISNPDQDEEYTSSDEESSKSSEEPYSQTDQRFMLELYRENRELLDTVARQESEIARLTENNTTLKSSNVFWMCCYMGSVFCTLISLTLH